MKTVAFLTIILLLNPILSLHAQPTDNWKPKGSLDCVYKSKYSAKERLKNFPFILSDSIVLVSFRHQKGKLPIGDSIITDSLLEVKSLSKSEIDEMTDILYNNFYKKKANYGLLEECFYPRHAILFYGSGGLLLEKLLLCFHCNRYAASSDKFYWGDNCTQKMDKLRQFFIKMNVSFGTDTSVMIFPGENIRSN